jgi:hypothetical protein
MGITQRRKNGNQEFDLAPSLATKQRKTCQQPRNRHRFRHVGHLDAETAQFANIPGSEGFDGALDRAAQGTSSHV